MKGDVLLKLENVSKRYGGVSALSNISLEISHGEIHGLVGENGSGKSTLVKIVTGVVEPEEGSVIVFEGRKFEKLDPSTALNLGIHVVHQDLSLFPNLTVAENISVHLYSKNFFVNWKEIKRFAEKILDSLGIDMDVNALTGELSLADQQIVAIARAIAGEAKLLILDEPTASLTSKEVEKLFRFLKFLKSKGISVLFISHRLDEVLDISDNVTVLRDGRKIGTFRSSELTKDRLSKMMTGQEIDYGFERKEFKVKDVLLKVENLTKKGQFEKISFTLRKGEILGIIGPRGSGRTELALALFGMNKPDEGKIFIEGEEVTILSNRDAINLGISYVPENRLIQGLVLKQPVSRNIVITIIDNLTRRVLLDFQKMADLINESVEKFKIKVHDINDPVWTLSGGNQQKVVLAKWMLTEPRILILDSPTVGIDVGAKESIYKLIGQFSSRGIGIILISDEISEILNICDRFLLMKHGRIIKEFRAHEIDDRELEKLIKL